MMVKSFLAWMDRAGPMERAQAVDMLARAFLSRALGGDSPAEVEAALTSILDDPSPQVRKTLALIFADRADAPRHIVQALAADQPQVSAILIARSPLLTEADLVELAFAVEGLSLAAIAMRLEVPRRVSQAIIRREIYDASLALARNLAADIDEDDLILMAQTFGDRADLREALLARPGLPAVVRYILVTMVARRIGDFASGGGFLAGAKGQRVIDETIQSAVLAIGEKHPRELPGLVKHLRHNAELTPALLLRSVLGGDLGLLVAALAELTGLELHRVQSLMQARTDAAIAALFRRADLPAFLTRPLIGAIRASIDNERSTLSGFALPVIRAAQAMCLDVTGEEGVRLLALLRRYEAEAARLESRRLAEDLRSQARSEFTQLTLRADQVRQLEELDADERVGSVRPYEEIGFEPAQITVANEDPDADLWAMRGTILPADEPIGHEPPVLDLDAELTVEDQVAVAPEVDELIEDAPIQPELDDEPAMTPATSDLKALILAWRLEREERDRAAGLSVASTEIGPANDATPTRIAVPAAKSLRVA